LCFERRFSKQSSDIHLKSNILAPTEFLGWLRHCPYDVIHDVIFCKIYVFADSQRSRLLFLAAENVFIIFTRLLVALDCKPHEMVLKINAS